MTHSTDNTNQASGMSRPSIANLRGIDQATAEAALAELGLSEPEFWALDADRFEAVMAEHFQRVEAWKLREDARIDQIEAARASIQGVPDDMSIWAAGQEGFIDSGTARNALHAVFQLQQAEETDPQPDAEAVLALLNAVFGKAIDGSAEA